MSIARLFDHQVRVYRMTRTRDATGDPVPTWAAQGSAPTVNNARADEALMGAQQNRGAGDEMVTRRRWFLDAGLTVLENDVLSVTAGQETGAKLRVHSVVRANKPLVLHHIEVNVDPWEGSLT